MSGGDKLNDDNPCTPDLIIGTPQPENGLVILRAVIEECMKDPYGFIENERMRQGE